VRFAWRIREKVIFNDRTSDIVGRERSAPLR
jgi:hypothetical protein